MEDKNNTGLLTGHIGKYFHNVLSILLSMLVNWGENLRLITDKDLSFLLHMLLVRILAWMGTSDMLDKKFGIDLLDF